MVIQFVWAIHNSSYARSIQNCPLFLAPFFLLRSETTFRNIFGVCVRVLYHPNSMPKDTKYAISQQKHNPREHWVAICHFSWLSRVFSFSLFRISVAYPKWCTRRQKKNENRKTRKIYTNPCHSIPQSILYPRPIIFIFSRKNIC